MTAPQTWWLAVAGLVLIVVAVLIRDLVYWFRGMETVTGYLRMFPVAYLLPLGLLLIFVGVLTLHLLCMPWSEQ